MDWLLSDRNRAPGPLTNRSAYFLPTAAHAIPRGATSCASNQLRRSDRKRESSLLYQQSWPVVAGLLSLNSRPGLVRLGWMVFLPTAWTAMTHLYMARDARSISVLDLLNSSLR